MQKVVLKLGGSLITTKDATDFPLSLPEILGQGEKYIRTQYLQRIGEEIYKVTKEIPLQLIVANGAGIFGHPLVKNLEKLSNVTDVHNSVEYLNKRVVDYLRNNGLNVKFLSPFSFCTYNGKEFDYKNFWEKARNILSIGAFLSTYGDIVKVTQGKGDCDGYQVVSADDLAPALAKLWGAEKIIMLMNRDGVYDKSPDYSDARLIKVINANEKPSFIAEIGTTDVTGGIWRKVEKLQEAAKKGIRSQIINGLVPGNLEKALYGDESIGTLIVP